MSANTFGPEVGLVIAAARGALFERIGQSVALAYFTNYFEPIKFVGHFGPTKIVTFGGAPPFYDKSRRIV